MLKEIEKAIVLRSWVYGFLRRNWSRDDHSCWNDDLRDKSDDLIAIPIKFDNVSRAMTANKTVKTCAAHWDFLFAYKIYNL